MDINEVLAEHGDIAAEVAEILYGDAYEVSKAAKSAEQRKKEELAQTRISQAMNLTGLGAGIAATPAVYRETKQAYRNYRKSKGLKVKPLKDPITDKIPGLKKLRAAKAGPKTALALASANLGLQAANIGGDTLTNAVLEREKKRKQADLSKSVEVFCEISKVDTDKRQVFGWASISKKDGKPVLDLQGDMIDTDELERAAYTYVLKSRKGGHEHQKHEDGPVHVSDLIESIVITDEKKKALGLPEEMPEGWWVGFKIHDDEVWELAKSGELAGFSIHGSGKRVPA